MGRNPPCHRFYYSWYQGKWQVSSAKNSPNTFYSRGFGFSQVPQLNWFRTGLRLLAVIANLFRFLRCRKAISAVWESDHRWCKKNRNLRRHINRKRCFCKANKQIALQIRNPHITSYTSIRMATILYANRCAVSENRFHFRVYAEWEDICTHKCW